MSRVGNFDKAAEIHDRHPVADVPDDREVVRHEQIGHAQPPLQVDQQVEDLGAHRYVERRDGLVADDQRRLQRQRAGDDDALALPAGELVRIAARMLGPQANRQQQFADAAFELLAAGDTPHRERLADRRRRSSCAD